MSSQPLARLPDQAIDFLQPYLPQKLDRIYVTLTFAQSLDSRIAAGRGQRTQLSGIESKSMTHYLRGHHDAILVGANTVLADNPSLNCRYPVKGKSASEVSPRPIVVDPSFRCGLSKQSKVVQSALAAEGKAPWIIVSSEWRNGASLDELRQIAELESTGARVVPSDGLFGTDTWTAVFKTLSDNGITSVMVEGGAKVINELLLSNIDSLVITVAPVYLGQDGVEVSPKDPFNLLREVKWHSFGRDVVMASFKDNF
ncbi:dihydrofolate reductase-like domain-containing protein [Lipomyces arxii]|uniref:dihydrofolate reductase-like domain-containing protein n=1 Tax=Lipomyces arxii TaxID=56418 RepID=UPI0034CFD190